MSLATFELVRITVDTPQRRLDVAVPADVPVADLVLALVRAGGEGLADLGAATGWIVRRADGTALSSAQTLTDQGVRDGAVLHLLTADVSWPEFEFDDIADAIAGARRTGRSWTAVSTRHAGAATGVVALLIGLAATVRAHPDGRAFLAGGLTLVLLGLGSIAARMLDDPRAGTVLTGVATAYAFASGFLARGTGAHLLVGCAAAAIAAGIALTGTGVISEILVAVVAAAVAGAAGAGLDHFATAPEAAAIMLGLIALGAGLIPAAAVRIGGLAGRSATDPLITTVVRTERIVTGLIIGTAITAAVAATELAFTGGGWARFLALAGAITLASRARTYGSVPQRVTALAAGAAAGLPVLAWAVWSGTALTTIALGLVVVGAATVLISARRSDQRLLNIAAEWVDTAALLAVVPLLCGALNLYAKARQLT